MPEAKSLSDLLLIRHHNEDLIESFNDNLGSALGYKKRTGEPHHSGKPAVIIFVPRKLDPKWLPSDQVIPKILTGPGDLYCEVDVVEGTKYHEVYFPVLDEPPLKKTTEWAKDPAWFRSTDFLDRPPLTLPQLVLLEQLRGWSKKIIPGSQLFAYATDGLGYYGTLGCFARDNKTRALGLLTNAHVADEEGNELWYAEETSNVSAKVPRNRIFEYIPDEERFPNFLDGKRAYYSIDCAFAKFLQPVDDLIDPKLNLVNDTGRIYRKKMSAPYKLDLNTMGPIGMPVLGVGRTRSLQRGVIAAFAYEWDDLENESNYTDYLIANRPGELFSDFGDSGKLIVSDDGNYQPVGLLWGGWRAQLGALSGQEDWTYAIDIGVILEKLDITLVRSGSD